MTLAARRVQPGEGARLRTVRLAALADAPGAFASTWEEAAALEDEVWTERARRGSEGGELATFLLVDDGAAGSDEALGLVVGHRQGPDPSRVEVVSMWVHPSLRRHGGGRLLVDAVAEWARETGASALDLWVMRGNGGATAFYERLGFTPTDAVAVADDPCRDELRMTRPLPSA